MDLVRDPKKRRGYEETLFRQAYDWIMENQEPIRFHWQLQVSYLFTETIVESVCSKIRAVYNANRRKMSYKTLGKLLQVMMMLPDDSVTRSRIVEHVAKRYEELYGDTIIRDQYYKRERRKAQYSTVLDRKYEFIIF